MKQSVAALLPANAGPVLVLVLCCSLLTVAQPRCDPGAEPRAECFKKCVKGYRLAETEKDYAASDCGEALNDIPFDEDVDPSACCHVRNVCYGTCNVSRSMCEDEFGRCLRSLCNMASSAPAKRSQCSEKAEGLKQAVDSTAVKIFKYQQFLRCECIREGFIPARYLKIATKFLEKAVPPKDLKKKLQDLKSKMLRMERGSEWRFLLELQREYPGIIAAGAKKKGNGGNEDL